MRTASLLFCFFIAGLFSATAQNTTKILGTVNDESGKAVPAATVSLLKASDSALVKVALSEATGTFEFNGVKDGSYLLAVSNVGYAKATSKSFTLSQGQSLELPAITLAASAASLSSVTVQARRPLVENKIDKMVVNVDASPTNAGSTVLEVLEKSPGISVDRDGNISLKGKQGIVVLMDGKQTYLSGQDLANLLRNMPANQLDQIEIMTQPSAKFDAAGNSGIINLRTKKSTLRGFNGAINLGYVQGRYPKSPNSVQFNYRTPRLNLFSNFSYSYWSGFNDQTLLRTFRNSSGEVTAVFDQVANQRNHSTNYNGRVGLDYNLNAKTTIGILVNGTTRPGLWQNRGRADIKNGAGAIDSFNTAFTENRDRWNNIGGNLNFKRVLPGTGHELTADFDYLRYTTGTKQVSDNYNYSPGGALLSDPFLLRGNLPSDIIIYSGKADYVRALKDGAKVEAGVKSSYVSTDNDAQYTRYDRQSDGWYIDNTRSNHFLYTENINAAYVNVSRQLKGWGFQAGLRAENTVADGNQMGNATQKDSTFHRSHTQFFPTAYISYNANDKNTFSLSYGRRIERPNYQDMNPFQYFLDQYTFRQGNPTLMPQFTHNIELSHNYKSALNTTLNYTSTTDILNDILKQNDETKVTYQTKENIASRKVLGLSLSYNASLTKWWTTSLFSNVNYNHYKGLVNNTDLDVKLATFMFSGNQVFRFAKTWSAEISGFYRSAAQETGMYLIRPMGVFSFGFAKQLLNNKANLKLNIYDPFYVQKAKVDVKLGNIDAFVLNRWDNRRVALTFTYRFSKGQNGPPQQRRRTGSSQEEQNRVGGSQQ
ncbi:outer membrane beta-barrel family protein [Flavisolibacter nicotianae]|uniref:outer membrane beta-barrel family protein n=1 Tax=Flavisolibacter nicotianae TaxID=2364882 RepID=UPI0013C51BD6|nr:outer membrane beta-barrel family protein [Flavisolibacter nicotianae]